MTKLKRTYVPPRGPDSNRLDLLPAEVQEVVRELCRERAGDLRPCVETNHACYLCQDAAAARLATAPVK